MATFWRPQVPLARPASPCTQRGPTVRLRTTCASCGTELDIVEHTQKVCATCPPSPEPGDVLHRGFLAAAAVDTEDSQARADDLAAHLDAYENRPPRFAAAALAYAAWGWPVFPVKAGHKTPLTRHGVHDASTDAGQLAAWWARWPTANVGLPTGHRYDVVDVDPAGLSWWVQVRLLTRDTFHGLVSTPRGGYHLYRLASGSGNLADFAPGVDYRGRGGYVIAPPSRLCPEALSGPAPNWPLRYTWLVRPSPSLTGVAAPAAAAATS